MAREAGALTELLDHGGGLDVGAAAASFQTPSHEVMDVGALKGQTTSVARFASMPASSVANESENFCTPSDSSVAVTSS